MAKQLPSDLYAQLTAAGFDPQAATTMVAIAGAESSYNDAALGDQGLQTSTWGPSFGLFQIRTLKTATGSGGDRDIATLAGNDQAQIRAAYDISHGGTDFSPWTTYTSGKYQQFLPTAAQAATAGGEGGGGLPTWGPSWLPWNWPSVAGNAAQGATTQVLAGARSITVEAAFVILGLALVAGGLATAVVPASRAYARRAAPNAKQAVKLAAL